MSTSPKLTPTLTVVSPDAQKDSAEAVAKYLAAQEDKELLRFLTCGSVDDGKSTLIGRLLYDSRVLFEDHLAALENDSRKHGTTGDDIDLALLVDGLEAERQQGITIDVAYRFFATDRRKFIVADTPGHEQYTRNMATGASTAEVAVILVDARKGVLTQTRRHAYIANLLGIRNVVLAVNKIDLVDFDRQVFDRIVADFGAFASNMAFQTVVAIPMSARYGDNVVRSSERMPWYHGPHLLGFLETVPIGQAADDLPFRMPVQWVNRPNQDFRGYSGTIASGRVAPGDGIVVADNGKPAVVDRIVTMDGDLDEAFAGDAVTLTLDRELDIARGDMLAADNDRPDVADLMAAEIVWMNDEPMIPGRSYMMRIGTRTVAAHITDIKYKTDVNSFDRLAGKTLELNEIALCDLALAEPVAFDAYERVRDTGSFILIDRYTNATVGAGMVRFALRRAANIHLQALDVDKAARARLKGQRPVLLWFTGLSGSGKSTVANLVEKALHARGRHTQLLDGDNVRHGLNRDLSFSEADRVENIRRIGEVAKLFVDSGTIVLVSFISPYRAERRMARELVEDSEFIEIFVDTPLEVCKARDVKGLYAKAERGEIKNFTGISAPYEAPENPEITVNTAEDDAETLAERIVAYLEERGYLTAG